MNKAFWAVVTIIGFLLTAVYLTPMVAMVIFGTIAYILHRKAQRS